VKSLARVLFFAGLASFSLAADQAPPEPIPLTRVHAHNDYEHPRPLFDALDHGFCSVEADIYLVAGELRVAHFLSQTRAERTLRTLYLDPLRERVRKNNGWVYPGGPQVVLLVDLKTDWHKLYPALRQELQQYSEMLTTYQSGVAHSNAVSVIITGDRSTNIFAGETVRLAALDGELEDLDSALPGTLVPWISCNWSKVCKWRGTGPFPPDERATVDQIVSKAHQQGKRVRFWGAPDTPVFWRMLLDTGVDLINTDDLAGCQKFLFEAGVK